MSSQSSSDVSPLEVVFAFYAACNRSSSDAIARLLAVDATWVDRKANGPRTYQGCSAVCERSMRSPATNSARATGSRTSTQTVPTSVDRVTDAEIVVTGRILEGRRETPFTDRIDVDDGHIRGIVRERENGASTAHTEQGSNLEIDQRSNPETDLGSGARRRDGGST